MTMMRMVLAVLMVAALAQPAEARRRFAFFSFGGSGSAERIDPVRDLPDTETFKRDGEYWDLGFLYTTRKVAGVTVKSDRATGHFVLYHGDRYIDLSPELHAALTGLLGSDPVADFNRAQAGPAPDSTGVTRAEYAADPDAATAKLRARDAARPDVAPAAGGGASSMAGWALLFLILMGVGIFFARRITGGAARVARRVTGGEGGDDGGLETDSFDARVAARLAQLRGGDDAPDQTGAPLAAAPGLAPAVRGFGRKGA